MKGTYCLVMNLSDDARIRVGAIGTKSFPAGIYLYIGSALSGIEQRVARHVRKTKKKRWHIDYLLSKAEVLSIISVPTQDKGTECAVARALASIDGARVTVPGFGSSDCDCESHLLYFGPEEPAWVCEMAAKAVSMLTCVYPSRTGTARE